jgi:hypothetical protein
MRVSRWVLPVAIVTLFLGGVALARVAGVWRDHVRELPPVEKYVPYTSPSGDDMPM